MILTEAQAREIAERSTLEQRRSILLLAAALKGWHLYNAASEQEDQISWDDWCAQGERINRTSYDHSMFSTALALAFGEPVMTFPAGELSGPLH